MYYEIIIKWFVPFIFTSLFTFIAKIINDLKKDRERNTKDHKIMNDAMPAVLRCQILTKIEFYLDLGYLPDYGRVTISELYKIYLQLREIMGSINLLITVLHCLLNRIDKLIKIFLVKSLLTLRY